MVNFSHLCYPIAHLIFHCITFIFVVTAGNNIHSIPFIDAFIALLQILFGLQKTYSHYHDKKVYKTLDLKHLEFRLVTCPLMSTLQDGDNVTIITIGSSVCMKIHSGTDRLTPQNLEF